MRPPRCPNVAAVELGGEARGGVDGFDLNHSGLAGLGIYCARDVDALAPARPLDREILLTRRPATGGPRGMGRMHCVGEQHDLVVGQRIQDFFIVRDESLLFSFVELAQLSRLTFKRTAHDVPAADNATKPHSGNILIHSARDMTSRAPSKSSVKAAATRSRLCGRLTGKSAPRMSGALVALAKEFGLNIGALDRQKAQARDARLREELTFRSDHSVGAPSTTAKRLSRELTLRTLSRSISAPHRATHECIANSTKSRSYCAAE